MKVLMAMEKAAAANQEEVQEEISIKIDEIVAVSIEGIVFEESDVIQLKEELLLELTDDQVYLERGKSSWSEHVFGYMPVAACYPLFRKYQNDAKNSVQQIKAYIDSVLGIEDKE